MWPFTRRPPAPVPLEEQLAVLASCGIRLRPGVTTDSLLRALPREYYESNPYHELLGEMGDQDEELGIGWRPQDASLGWRSDDVLFVDTECIENHGDYARIAERMRALSGGALPLENIRDYVDVEAGDAWLEFDLDGERQHWDLEVDGDWIDTTLFSRFVALMNARGAGRRYTYISGGGQTFLVGCSTEEELRCLRERTGLGFAWLG